MDYDLRLWVFYADMNADGVITISDVWLWFKWLYFYPGDGLLYAVIHKVKGMASFFEITQASYGGAFSGSASFLAWLIGFGVIATIYDDFSGQKKAS